MGNASALGSSSGALAVNAGLLDLNGHSLGVGGLSGGGTITDLAGSGADTLTVGNGGGGGGILGHARQRFRDADLRDGGQRRLGGLKRHEHLHRRHDPRRRHAELHGLGLAARRANSIVFNGGTLQWATANTADVSAALAPLNGALGATFDTNGNHVVFASPLSGSGGLTKAGAGMLSLSAAGSLTGPTTVTGGTLAIGDTAGMALQSSAVTVSGGVLGLSVSAASVASLSGAGNVNLNNGVLTAGGNGASSVFSGVISNSGPAGGFVKAGSGTLTLTNNNIYSGTTLISAGIVRLAGTATGSPVTAGLLYDVDASNAATLYDYRRLRHADQRHLGKQQQLQQRGFHGYPGQRRGRLQRFECLDFQRHHRQQRNR